MKIVHWTFNNGSGLNRVSCTMSVLERTLGLDSFICYSITDPNQKKDYAGVHIIEEKDALDADIHVIHSHVPDTAKGKRIFMAHGTPEHCFTMAIDQAKGSIFGGSDPFMLSLYRLANSDITVTFWERHWKIWKTFAPKAEIKVIPMGVDTDFWQRQQVNKLGGDPSLLTCENAHMIKWPLDLFLSYPFIMREMPNVFLHAHYIPADQHRYWYPLLYANGTAYRSHTSGAYFSPEELRNLLSACDYYISLVRYGDFNAIGLEAKSCGAKVISYPGNPYADYWVSEGSQEQIAKEMIEIFKGDRPAQPTLPISSILDTTKQMVELYESITKN